MSFILKEMQPRGVTELSCSMLFHFLRTHSLNVRNIFRIFRDQTKQKTGQERFRVPVFGWNIPSLDCSLIHPFCLTTHREENNILREMLRKKCFLQISVAKALLFGGGREGISTIQLLLGSSFIRRSVMVCADVGCSIDA